MVIDEHQAMVINKGTRSNHPYGRGWSWAFRSHNLPKRNPFFFLACVDYSIRTREMAASTGDVSSLLVPSIISRRNISRWWCTLPITGGTSRVGSIATIWTIASGLESWLMIVLAHHQHVQIRRKGSWDDKERWDDGGVGLGLLDLLGFQNL